MTATSAIWNEPLPTMHDVLRARQVISSVLRPTPALEFPALSELMGCTVIVKCENLQPIGAFKVRGGVFLMDGLSADQRRRGVVGASTGNHGQSIAFAGRQFGVPVTIFVPNGANPLKVRAMERLGADVRFAEDDFSSCHEVARVWAAEHDRVFVHSANEPALVAGVATYTFELLEEHPDLDAIFVPIGGGSGCAGACLVTDALSPATEVYGVTAARAPAPKESWQQRELLHGRPSDTFAEGMAVGSAYAMTSAILWDRVADIIDVTDAELKRAMLTTLQTTRMLAEGAGVASVAALHKTRDQFKGKDVAVVLSGGNVTLESLAGYLAEERAW